MKNKDKTTANPASEPSDQITLWSEGNRIAKLKIWGVAIVLIIIFIGSFNFGRFTGIGLWDAVKVMAHEVCGWFGVDWPQQTWPDKYRTVVCLVRFPRIFAAVIIGGALALSGNAYQTVFKNPLVSPDILGASSGASLGAALAIFTGLSSPWIQIFAFAGAILAVLLAYIVSSKVKRDPTLALVLSGVIVSSLGNALVSLLKFLADPNDKLPAITYWLMGSLNGIGLSDLKWALIPMIIAALPLFLLRWRLNVLSLGENEAKALGIETAKLRKIVIACATLLTATAISIGGLIGWVGLVIPHLMRLFVGANNKVLVPASTLCGGAFLLVVDNVARSISTSEIPIGVLTAIIGAPFFIILLVYGKENKE